MSKHMAQPKKGLGPGQYGVRRVIVCRALKRTDEQTSKQRADD